MRNQSVMCAGHRQANGLSWIPCTASSLLIYTAGEGVALKDFEAM